MYEIKNISKSYGDLEVIKDISICFQDNKTTCILGPSGCGKTTILKIICGIIKDYGGQTSGFDENISFVFQEDRLIEWKNVIDNIRFVLKGKMGKEDIDKNINAYLELVNLLEYKHYYPNKLSGGMRQRVSILRAFLYPSKLLIMDEPFKSLDINNKRILISFFKLLKEREKKTCIIVTHHIDEAISLADRIIILSNKPTILKKVIDLNEKRNTLELKEIIEKELI